MGILTSLQFFGLHKIPEQREEVGSVSASHDEGKCAVITRDRARDVANDE